MLFREAKAVEPTLVEVVADSAMPDLLATFVC
jgi:hypothetical protein